MCGLTLTYRCGGKTGRRLGVDSDGACDAVGTAAAGLHGERSLVCAGLGISVAGSLSRTGLIVAEVPLVTGDLVASGSAGELGGIALTHGGVGETCSGEGIHGDGSSDGTSAVAVAGTDGKRGLVSAGLRVCMGGVLSRTRLVVTEVPFVIGDGLSTGVGGGSAGELCGTAGANCSVGEIGCGLCIHHNGFCCSIIALVANSDGAGVLSRVIQGAVGDGRVL